MAYVNVDIDLDEFDNDEIIDEVEERFMQKRRGSKFSTEEKKRLANIVRGIDTDKVVPSEVCAENLMEADKWRLLEEVFQKYNREQIQDMITRYENV